MLIQRPLTNLYLISKQFDCQEPHEHTFMGRARWLKKKGLASGLECVVTGTASSEGGEGGSAWIREGDEMEQGQLHSAPPSRSLPFPSSPM